MIPIQIRMIFQNLRLFLTFKYGLMLAVCTYIVFIQMNYRVPGPIILILLPSIGVVLTALNFILLLSHFLISLPSDDPLRRLLKQIERGITNLIFLFFIYSAVIFVNGRSDTTLPIEHTATVVAINENRLNIGSISALPWVELTSWEGKNKSKHLLLGWREKEWIWPGQPVLIQIRQGLFGIPWVFKLERDKEKYYQKILEAVPNAAETWKDLTRFYLDRKKWKQAAETAEDYLKIYPKDYEFAKGTAAVLGQAHQNAEMIALLEPFLSQASLSKKQNYELYNLVGWGAHYLGDNSRAVKLSEASIPFDPENWWAYYQLGYIYHHTGKPKEAIAMFKKVLERRPGFPEIEQQLSLLQKTEEREKEITKASNPTETSKKKEEPES